MMTASSQRCASGMSVMSTMSASMAMPPTSGGGGIAHAVTDNLAGLEFLDGGDARLDRHDRFDAGYPAANGGGKYAVHQNFHPDHVKMGVRQIQEAAAVAGVAELYRDAAGGHGLQDVIK